MSSASISLDGDFWQVVEKKLAHFKKISRHFVGNLCMLADKNLSVMFCYFLSIFMIFYSFFFTKCNDF